MAPLWATQLSSHDFNEAFYVTGDEPQKYNESKRYEMLINLSLDWAEWAASSTVGVKAFILAAVEVVNARFDPIRTSIDLQ